MQRRIWVMLALTACTDLAIDDDPESIEGSKGHVRVQTPQGSELLAYTVDRDGHAIHEGDLDLGPVAGLSMFGGAAHMNALWPASAVNYYFDSDFNGDVCRMDDNGQPYDCENVRTRVRRVLGELEKRLPLIFTEVDSWHSIEFKWADYDVTYGGKSNWNGMNPIGGQSIKFRSGHDMNDPDANDFNLQPRTDVIAHETLHAIGLWHEQSRHDRDAFIQIHPECIVDSSEDQYEIKSGATELGPYDYQSVMHYWTDAFCELNAGGTCLCPTMEPLAPGVGIGFHGAGTNGRGDLSIEDVNTLYRMYAWQQDKPRDDVHHGSAVAIGDFDHDGYDDIAIGMPDAPAGPPNFEPNAGKVMLYRGTSVGPVVWRTLTEANFGGTISEGARFGASLVAFNWNGDNVRDLAIGAPGAAKGAGSVTIYSGSYFYGPVAERVILQSSIGQSDEEGDRFGEALAAGPITGTERPAACIDEFDNKLQNRVLDTLVVGAPGDRNAKSRNGAVYLLQYFVLTAAPCDGKYVLTSGDFALAAPTRIAPSEGATGDDFGAALAVGDLDREAPMDLAIGAPHEKKDTGSVSLYHGRRPPEASPLLWSSMVSFGQTLPGTQPLQYGAALAIGDLGGPTQPNGTPTPELAIGAPGVYGRVIVMSGTIGAMSMSAFLVDDSPEVGDRFGAALAIGDVDRTDKTPDLVIGIPGESSESGAIAILRGGVPGLAQRSTFREKDLGAYASDAGDRFGAALAIGQLDGKGEVGSIAIDRIPYADLAIGVPGKQHGSGHVHLMRDQGVLVKHWGILDAGSIFVDQ